MRGFDKGVSEGVDRASQNKVRVRQCFCRAFGLGGGVYGGPWAPKAAAVKISTVEGSSCKGVQGQGLRFRIYGTCAEQLLASDGHMPG